MNKNSNIERHNEKYHIGATVQGAVILDILKYSKNGKSTNFLWRCKCGQVFEAGSSYRIKKLCPDCLNELNAQDENQEPSCQRHVGIYALRFRDFYYIGESINLEQRLWQHQEDLENNKHCNGKLQSMYNQGIRFQFEIIESAEFVKGYTLWFKLLNLHKEKEYIREYIENGFHVLNSENSIQRLKETPELLKIYNEFKQLGIECYDDILRLPIENNRRWNKFKRIFYNNNN
jgi:hypothetical protein